MLGLDRICGLSEGRGPPTWFLSDLAWSGSSAASMQELIRIQPRTMLPKYGWLQILWHRMRNLQIKSNMSTHDFSVSCPEWGQQLTCWLVWRQREQKNLEWVWSSLWSSVRTSCVVEQCLTPPLTPLLPLLIPPSPHHLPHHHLYNPCQENISTGEWIWCTKTNTGHRPFNFFMPSSSSAPSLISIRTRWSSDAASLWFCFESSASRGSFDSW